jgi:hypothetical protein
MPGKGNSAEYDVCQSPEQDPRLHAGIRRRILEIATCEESSYERYASLVVSGDDEEGGRIDSRIKCLVSQTGSSVRSAGLLTYALEIKESIIKMSKNNHHDLSKGELIKADLYSRANAISGKYSTCRLGLDDLSRIKDDDIFFLETLKMKADLADKMIAEATFQGKDTSDPNVMKELGELINAAGTPIHRSQSVMTAFFVSARLMVYYGIAAGIWGFVFERSFLVFGFFGLLAGFIISLVCVAPVIAFQRTRERIRDVVFGVGATWGMLGIVIGILGLVALTIRLVFF